MSSMAFPAKLTSRLTGVTPSQLTSLRQKGVVVPEINPYRPPLYSFRDILALRTIARLRAMTSAQRIHKAFLTLDVFDLTEHPAAYRFGSDGDTIFVEHNEQAVDLVKHPGQVQVFPFSEALGAFEDWRGRRVDSLAQPAQGIAVRPGRMGGWPTVEGTRVPYDIVAGLVDDVTVTAHDVPHFYPTVSVLQAQQAVDFDRQVEQVPA